MKYYQQYFEKEIAVLTTVVLSIYLFAIVIEIIFSSSLYDEWIIYFNYPLLFLGILLLLLSLFKVIQSKTAGVLFAFIFTLNIYLPGFINTESIPFIITSFTNLGACLVLIILIYFTGNLKSGLILGLLNVAGILSLYFYGLPDIKFDVSVLLIFISITIFFYILICRVNLLLREHERRNRQINAYQRKKGRIRWEEEKKRVSFLMMLHKDYQNFIASLLKKLYKIVNEKDINTKNNLLKEHMQFCRNQKSISSQLAFMKHIDTVDADFFAHLKARHPALTDIELQICSLLRYDLTSQEIGEKLNKSSETVKWYRKRIRKKFNLSDKDNLALFCNQL